MIKAIKNKTIDTLNLKLAYRKGFEVKIADIFKLLAFPSLVYLANWVSCTFFPLWYFMNSVDTYFHFLGGLSIAYPAYLIINILNRNDLVIVKNRLLKGLMVISIVATTAVLWEFYEFTIGMVDGINHQPSNFDTMKDLFMGLAGGTFFSLLYSFIKK